MRQTIFSISCLAFMTACGADETVQSYGAANKVWKLVELDGETFAAPASLTFTQKHKISGAGPCNSFRADMSTPYPWFKLDALASTKMVCPELAAETRFFNALTQATLSEVLGNTMILSNTDGLSMVFKASD